MIQPAEEQGNILFGNAGLDRGKFEREKLPPYFYILLRRQETQTRLTLHLITREARIQPVIFTNTGHHFSDIWHRVFRVALYSEHLALAGQSHTVHRTSHGGKRVLITHLRQDLDLDHLLVLVGILGDGDGCLARGVQPRAAQARAETMTGLSVGKAEQ